MIHLDPEDPFCHLTHFWTPVNLLDPDEPLVPDTTSIQMMICLDPVNLLDPEVPLGSSTA
jgi:hypothetical protein